MNTIPRKPNRLIGLIRSSGIGPEVIDVAIRCFKTIGDLSSVSLQLDFFDPQPRELKPDEASFKRLCEFYGHIREAGGVILRASCHATLVYRLRQEFDLFYKLVPIQVIPELAQVSVLDLKRLNQMDLLLIRDNAQGPYHAAEQVHEDGDGQRTISLDVKFDERRIRRLAHVAFELAVTRRKKVHLLLKGDVHRQMLRVWLEAMERVKADYPDVEFDWDQPDCGLADMFIAPGRFDVVIAMDVDADIIGDWLAGLLHGSRALTPSGNFTSPTGFASYQTIHGTCDRLAGTGKANPLGMLMACAMLMECSLGMLREANGLRESIRQVLAQGYRTGDITRPSDPPGMLLGTEQMAQRVFELLPANLSGIAR